MIWCEAGVVVVFFFFKQKTAYEIYQCDWSSDVFSSDLTLADLIAKRRHCLAKLRDLGLKQSELILAGEMGALLRSLSAKNQWIVAVQTIEKELAPYHEQDPSKRVWASQTQRNQCANQAAECKDLLDEIMQLEHQNEQKMTERRDQVANQLQTAHAAGTVCTAYQAQQMR